MSKFSERFKELRKSRKLSQQALADSLNTSKSSVNMYERGEREPGIDTLETIADFFNVDMDYLLGKSDIVNKAIYNKTEIDLSRFLNIKPVKKIKLPMLGKIACGEPIFDDEDHETYVEVDESYGADFCLTAQGDSMINAGIENGDTVLIREAPIVENGEIAAVIIDDEATLKRVYYYKGENKLVLQAENPRYSPFVYLNEELEFIRIIGKAVAVIKRLK